MEKYCREETKIIKRLKKIGEPVRCIPFYDIEEERVTGISNGVLTYYLNNYIKKLTDIKIS